MRAAREGRVSRLVGSGRSRSASGRVRVSRHCRRRELGHGQECHSRVLGVLVVDTLSARLLALPLHDCQHGMAGTTVQQHSECEMSEGSEGHANDAQLCSHITSLRKAALASLLACLWADTPGR